MRTLADLARRNILVSSIAHLRDTSFAWGEAVADNSDEGDEMAVCIGDENLLSLDIFLEDYSSRVEFLNGEAHDRMKQRLMEELQADYDRGFAAGLQAAGVTLEQWNDAWRDRTYAEQAEQRRIEDEFARIAAYHADIPPYV